MKKFLRIVAISALALVALYLSAWISASIGLLRDVEFGYFGEFNIAKHAIQKSDCAKLIEYSGVNKDFLFLEEFHFKVTTRSGRIVRLWFDAENMDVSQVCHRPVGFSVTHSAYVGDRRYSPDMLSEILKEKGIEVKSLNDVLCNIEELEQIFKTVHGDAQALRESDEYVWDYLHIEFPTEERLRGWKYTDVKEKDVVNWP